MPYLPYLPYGTERANIQRTMQAQVLRAVVHSAYLPYLPYIPSVTQRTNIPNPMQEFCMRGVMRPCLLIGVHYAYLLTY